MGCGKSSLLSGILGEMHKMSGSINLNGIISYAPQTAFIQNTTLRNNIIFTNDYDGDLYKRVLGLCSLNTDINKLPGGDLTEIGERVSVGFLMLNNFAVL